jgi:CSLREA domain-containing protein
VLVVVAGLAMAAVPQALASTWMVDQADDAPGGVCGVTGTGSCTLRAAIAAAQTGDTIEFDIGLGGPVTIALSSDLPNLTNSITIDGTSQTGYAGTPLVQLARTGGTTGIWLTTSNATVKGLVINAGFSSSGILIQGDNNTVASSYVGVDATGAAASGSFSFAALRVQGSGNTIGGATSAAGNVVVDGLSLEFSSGSGSSGNTVRSNLIGMNSAGLAALGSRGLLINEAANTVVRDNAIANGIQVQNTSGTSIKANRIGTTKTGTATAGGTQLAPGVKLLNTSGNTVGGIAPGDGNIIAFNVQSGIATDTTSTVNAFRGNSIFSNGGLGIDQKTDGVTANVVGDGIRNYPVLTSATQSSGTLTVVGTLTTDPDTTEDIEFFASSSGDSTGYGEGETYLGSISVTSNGSGIATFSQPFTTNVSSPSVVTATTTLQNQRTSEFSAAVTVSGTAGGGSDDPAQAGPTFVVNTNADPAEGDGVCTEADCTLREAIDAANGHGNIDGPDEIQFAIPGIGVQTITPDVELPSIDEPVLIDGTTQPDYLDHPLVYLDGSNTTCGIECRADGLYVAPGGSGSTIRGLEIGNFEGDGIELDGNDAGSVVESSWIGIGPLSESAGNGLAGIRITGGSGNTIGGTTAAQRVVIAGNASSFGDGQIVISGFSFGNTIQGSYIGLTPDGESNFDTEHGVVIRSGAGDNTVGGDSSAGEGNLIGGLYGNAVWLNGAGSGNTVAGNTIGINTLGDTDPTAAAAVQVDDTAGTTIGDDALPGDNTVLREFGNVLVGSNVGVGIDGSSTGTHLAGNFIGVDRDGGAIANGTGVSIGTSSGNTIGPFNTIARNTFDGVEVTNEGASGNRIVANSIHHNGGRGIELQFGANNSIEAPVITSALTSAGTSTVSGTVSGAPGTYYVELFRDPSCDAPSSGEGETYVSFATAAVGEGGTGSFTGSMAGTPAGTPVTATLTRASGPTDTSEFSSCVTTVPATGTVSLEPVADTFVAKGAPDSNFGTLDYADVYGGANPSCVLAQGRSYTLMRFDLSSIPAGAVITDARLEATTRAGWAQDGDPAHWALFIQDDDWIESGVGGVTWTTRPSDGVDTEGGTAYGDGAGPDIRQSPLSFGAADVWRNGCSVDPAPAGNQSKVFPSTTDGMPRTVAEARAGLISEIATQRDGDGQLSLELWTPNCPVCSVGSNLSYWGRYYTREAADSAVRPRLVITYGATPPLVTGLTITGPATVGAGASSVPLAGVPSAALVTPQSSGTQAAPVNQSPVNQSPVNQLPVNQLPVNQSPVNQSPVNQLPVNQSPVNQSGVPTGPGYFQTLALQPGPLGDTALSTIPLLRPGGWSAVLPAPLNSTPLQSVTLRQVFGLNPLPGPLRPDATNPIRFADIDFSNSPLGSLPAMTLALGQLPLSGISGVDWCALFSGPPLALGCTNPSTLTGTSLLSAALAGAPVNQSPVNQSPVNQSLIAALAAAQAPVNQLPVNQLPVNQLPVNQLPVNQSRILSFPVNQLPVNQSPVNQLSLNAILIANVPVNQSPVNQLPVNQLPVNQSVLQCGGVQCEGTLGDYVNKVVAGKTLGDLRLALASSATAPFDVPDTWTIANLEDFGNLIVGDLLKSLPQPNTLTLADVLALALFANNPESFAFETLNIFDTGLSLYAAPLLAAPYTVDFNIVPDVGGPSGVGATVAVSATLPPTFAYAPGSTTLVQSPGTCGGGTTVADPVVTQTGAGQTKLSWSVAGTVGNSYKLCFTARPGIILGPHSATASAKPTDGVLVSANEPEPVTVTDGAETASPNNDPTSAPMLASSSFYLSYLTSASDVDYSRFPVPPAGTRVTFHLSHLPADYDLVVYGPQQTVLRPVSASTPPLDGAPLTDTGSELTHVTDALPSQTLDDLRLQKLPIVGVSASRGTDPEDITVLSDGSAGNYTVQVTSYNGAASEDPYMLRLTTEAPRAPTTATSRTVTGTSGPAVGTLPTGFNTLFVVNRRRLEGFYGASAASSVMSTLTSSQANFAALGFPNAVLSVETNAAVQSAYNAWDANPGRPELANAVVAAINSAVDTVRGQANGAGLKYIVLVGGDRVIPQGRLGDFTFAANENGYADTFDRSSDLYAALHAGQMLSDDPYATTEPVPYLNRQLYVPRLAVGRLVETPAEIVATLSRFTAFSGKLNPTTSLTTGYDFMQDGAAAINAPFASRFGATNARTLIATGTPADWTTSSLIGAFLPTGGTAPSITSLNGHADHFEFAPPAVAPPYFTTGNLPLGAATAPAASTGALVNRLVFSMGCHSGLSVSDAIVTANTYDWPQAYAHNGVGAYLGNTGFGYGDSLVVAYSEQLDSIFARKIAAGSTVGNAVAAAKQEYFAGLGVFGVYDEKAMAEFTLYGLPMWSVTMPGGGLAPLSAQPASSGELQTLAVQAAPTVAPTTTAVVTDSATGLEAETFTLAGIANTENVTSLGRYWSGPDGVQVTHFRPLQPKAFIEATGTSGHGALVTELVQDADTPNVNPVFARPIVDTQSSEPELAFGDVAFPARIQALRTYRQDGILKQRVVLVTGQFFTGATPGTTGEGVQRLFTKIGARVLRSTSNDFVPPAFTRIDATGVGATAAFAVNVSDQTQTGTAGTVKRVLVAVRRGNDSTWVFSDLGQVGTSAMWSGGVPLPAPGAPFEYFVQAVDAAGNVAVSTNKGFYYAAAAPTAPAGNITVAPTITIPPSGWFGSSTPVAVSGPAGVTLEVSVDGGPFAPVAPGAGPTITGDGVHVVDARGSNGGSATALVPIDGANPTITIGVPSANGVYTAGSTVRADFTCADTGSGVASCSAEILSGPGTAAGPIANGAALPTDRVGTYTLKVSSADVVGHTSAKTVSYTATMAAATAFARNGKIWIVQPDGVGSFAPRQLTQLGNDSGATTRVDEQPAVSPDGLRVVFARRLTATARPQLWVIDADGFNPKQLVVDAGADYTAPTWAPTGTQIAFESTRTGSKGRDIWVGTFSTSGANAPTLSGLVNRSNATGDDITPDWARVGGRIAFSSNRKQSQFEIFTMKADGTDQQQLTNDPKSDLEPSYSPTGLLIAFSSDRAGGTGGFELYVMGAANGTNQLRITNSALADGQPHFVAPLSIVFVSARNSGEGPGLYSIAPSAVPPVKIAGTGSADKQPG